VPAVHTAAQRPLLAVIALALAAVGLAACGKAAPEQLGGGPTRKLAPVAAEGAVSVATRNTTRLGGADVASDAAAVARATYPGLTVATRPVAVVLVDEHDWLGALAASVLSSSPTSAPILYSEGEALPAVSRETLEAMRPLGAPTLGGAQVIRIGATTAPAPSGYLTDTLPVSAPAATAVAVQRLLATLDGGSAPHQVIVLATDTPPALAMPAAGLAAESGAPILFVTPARVPAATAAALAGLHRPSIYVIDAAALDRRTIGALRHFGPVTKIGGAHTTATGAEVGGEAVESALEVARYTDGTFGWGVKEPGHGLVFANAARPLDAPAAALLSATGDYGPLLLLASATQVPPAVTGYLSDIQPAYSAPQFPPVRGVYNHGWLIGDEQAISAVTQAEIDSILEIAPRKQTPEEASVSQVE
jgi:hypothetical protein